MKPQTVAYFSRRKEAPTLAPAGRKRDLRLGQQVHISARLERFTSYEGEGDTERVFRGWMEREIEPTDGVLVGLRFPQSGWYERNEFLNSLYENEGGSPYLRVTQVHRAALVAFNLYRKPYLVSIDNLEVIH